jgi:hypothetical protein
MKTTGAIIACLLSLVPQSPVSAQDPAPSTIEDDLFGGDLFSPETPAETPPGAEAPAPPDLMAGTLGVRLGGEFGFHADEKVLWRNLDLEDIASPTDTGLTPSLYAGFTMDARPDEHFRVLASAELSISGSGEAFEVRELFADWDWQDVLFFRAGKHAIHWGTGYFYSPADVLNLTPIDPEDPEAQREGPLSLRLDVPFGLSSLWGYVIAENIEDWSDIGLAAQAKLVVGDAEIGTGAFYRDGVSPRLIVTATFPVWKTSWFTEGVASLGADRLFVVEGDGGVLETAARTDSLFFQATAGFMLNLTDVFVDAENVVLAAQYYFNGTGYPDPSILLSPQIGALRASGSLPASDLTEPGMHYAAARLSWIEVFGSDFSAAVSWTSNLSDLSGRVQPRVSLELFDKMDFSASLSLSYGEIGEEFTPRGIDTILQLTVDAGSGRF